MSSSGRWNAGGGAINAVSAGTSAGRSENRLLDWCGLCERWMGCVNAGWGDDNAWG